MKQCAIYTRKSHEDGLEQEFNSLEFQRKAAEHYIQSQQHEGWVICPTMYEDGGYSGGTLDRPGLQALLNDIKAGLIQCVIVYKTDRLSRSLCDLMNTVNFFEKHDVIFASVTEPFNTGTTAGRLILHMLSSVGEYERQVTSDRIRDKIASSKQKGMWMGGFPPLGYDIVDKKLTINPKEADLIRLIFKRFLTLQSPMQLAQELNQKGYRSKQSVSATGKAFGSQKFSMSTIRKILINPIYKGFVRHKGIEYQGLHKPIVSEALWQAVQDVFNKNPRARSQESRCKAPALLKGLIYCQSCNTPMTPSYSVKKNKRYHYYVCTQHAQHKTCPSPFKTVASGEVERFVIQHIRLLLKSPQIIYATQRKIDATMTEPLQQLDSVWDQLLAKEQQRICHVVIKQINVCPKGIELVLKDQTLYHLLAAMGVHTGPTTNHVTDQQTRSFFLPLVVKKRGGSRMIVLPENQTLSNTAVTPLTQTHDKTLLQALVKAQLWQDQTQQYGTFMEFCKAQKLNDAYVRRLMRLNMLSPTIKSAILNGTQPRTLKLEDFIRQDIPLLWHEQHARFGIENTYKN